MGGVVRADDVGYALVEPMPETVAVRSTANRWIHLCQCSKFLICVLACKRKMLWRHFAGRDIAMLGNILKLGWRAYMQNMNGARCSSC